MSKKQVKKQQTSPPPPHYQPYRNITGGTSAPSESSHSRCSSIGEAGWEASLLAAHGEAEVEHDLNDAIEHVVHYEAHMPQRLRPTSGGAGGGGHVFCEQAAEEEEDVLAQSLDMLDMNIRPHQHAEYEHDDDGYEQQFLQASIPLKHAHSSPALIGGSGNVKSLGLQEGYSLRLSKQFHSTPTTYRRSAFNPVRDGSSLHSRADVDWHKVGTPKQHGGGPRRVQQPRSRKHYDDDSSSSSSDDEEEIMIGYQRLEDGDRQHDLQSYPTKQVERSSSDINIFRDRIVSGFASPLQDHDQQHNHQEKSMTMSHDDSDKDSPQTTSSNRTTSSSLFDISLVADREVLETNRTGLRRRLYEKSQQQLIQDVGDEQTVSGLVSVNSASTSSTIYLQLPATSPTREGATISERFFKRANSGDSPNSKSNSNSSSNDASNSNAVPSSLSGGTVSSSSPNSNNREPSKSAPSDRLPSVVSVPSPHRPTNKKTVSGNRGYQLWTEDDLHQAASSQRAEDSKRPALSKPPRSPYHVRQSSGNLGSGHRRTRSRSKTPPIQQPLTWEDNPISPPKIFGVATPPHEFQPRPRAQSGTGTTTVFGVGGEPTNIVSPEATGTEVRYVDRIGSSSPFRSGKMNMLRSRVSMGGTMPSMPMVSPPAAGTRKDEHRVKRKQRK